MKQKISVLCAVREDDVLRTLMQEMDDGEHCMFTIAHSGSQALRACEVFSPDILVVDAVLPGLDGPALVDRMREKLGAGMPRVIGGAMMPFARAAFARHGVRHIVDVPWAYEEVRAMLIDMMDEIDAFIDWEGAKVGFVHASVLLEHLGMHRGLHGFVYLSWAAALAALDQSRLHAIGERIYAPIAQREHTTPQNVERLIRHAVESTMDSVGAQELYAFFGNTIDPMRGKPTNAQMIAMLAQKVGVGEGKE